MQKATQEGIVWGGSALALASLSYILYNGGRGSAVASPTPHRISVRDLLAAEARPAATAPDARR